MKLSPSVKLAGALALAVIVYFGVRTLLGGGGEQQAAIEEEQFIVVADMFAPLEWRDEIIVRGRTQAFRKVTVRAETAGAVAATPAQEGAAVAKGDVLCKIALDARVAQRNEARAALNKAQLDYEAAEKLSQEGFRAETAVAAAKASLDLARANLERAEVELSKTNLAAPFDGVFDQRLVEIGDFMRVGDPCGAVIQRDPFLISGAVSEKDVAKISVDDRGVARLATGETLEGRVRFVAAAAHPATRTFDVELEVPNADGAIRDGVTAEFTVFARKTQAHRVPRSALTLNDAGMVGLRVIDAENMVGFAPIAIIGEDDEGIWVSGLEGDSRIIVRGQDYVSTGQRVDFVDSQTAAGERI